MLLEDLVENCQPSDLLVATTGQCELLAAEAQKFAGLSLPDTNSFTVWETRRLAINFGIFTISQIVGATAQTAMNSLSPKDNKDATSSLFLSHDVERTLAAQLSAGGTDIAVSTEAADALLKYCLHHKIQPSEIIEPELKKIHTALSPEILGQLVKITSTDISATPGGAISKARIVETSKSIRKGLAALNPFSISLSLSLAIFFVLTGLSISACGLKTGLKNDTPELRPPIPFRGDAPKQIFSNKPKTSPSNEVKGTTSHDKP